MRPICDAARVLRSTRFISDLFSPHYSLLVAEALNGREFAVATHTSAPGFMDTTFTLRGSASPPLLLSLCPSVPLSLPGPFSGPQKTCCPSCIVGPFQRGEQTLDHGPVSCLLPLTFCQAEQHQGEQVPKWTFGMSEKRT